MPKLSKPTLFIAVILVISVSVVAGSFWLSNQRKTDFFAISSPTPIPRIANVYYPIVPDPTGRNIYYIATTDKKALPYSGAGVLMMPQGSKITNEKGEALITIASSSAMIQYIVGTFDKWETIPNSKDKYLVLTNPVGIADEKGRVIPIPKIRVGFATKDFDDSKNIYNTAWAVEDLDSVIPKVINPNALTVYKLGLIGTIEPVDLNTLIKAGDTLAVTIKIDTVKKQDLMDKNNTKIASWIFIRRFNPKQELPKELNKPINLQ